MRYLILILAVTAFGSPVDMAVEHALTEYVKADEVVVVVLGEPVDAAMGYGTASEKDIPVLFVEHDYVPGVVIDCLGYLDTDTVYLYGGTPHVREVLSRIAKVIAEDYQAETVNTIGV